MTDRNRGFTNASDRHDSAGEESDGGVAASQQLRAELKAPRERLPGGRRRWIRSSMNWLVDEFGRDVLLRPIVLPDELIPAGYDGSLAAAEELCARVAERMDLPPAVRAELRARGDGVRRPAYREW